MSKSFRSFAFAAALALVAVPALHADRTGCNPHPQAVPVPSLSPAATIILSVINSLTL